MYKIIRIAILIFISYTTQAQTNPWRLTSKDFIIVATQGLAGAADGLNQRITHHKLGQGNKFWDASISWKNKYKDFDNGNKNAAFFGSKNIFVVFTDGFHLTRSIEKFSTLCTIIIVSGDFKKYRKNDVWKVIFKKALLSLLANRIAFNLVYK